MRSRNRALEVCRKLVPAFAAYVLTKGDPATKRASHARIRLRVALQDLGTTFIKLGQLLSARPDIAGLDLAAELRNLLDNEPAVPLHEIERIIEAETKQPAAKMFCRIDAKPLGTASIAQVHRAELLSGQIVAIKVQRLGVRETVGRDLPLLRRACRLLDTVIPSRSVRFSYLYAEFEDWIYGELDFRVEGRRADKFRENMKDVDGIVIPRIYWQQTTERMLVMSFIDGQTLNSLMNIMKEQQVNALYDAALPYPVDADLIIQRAVAAVAKQALVDRYFHGDLHPANIIIEPHSRVAFIDFGIIGTINAEEHAQILLTLVAIVQNDPEALMKVFKSLARTELTAADVADVHQRLSDELHRLQEDGSGRVSLNHFITVVFGIAQTYSLSFTQGFIIAMKTIAQIDAVAVHIGLRASLVSIMKPEVEKCLTQSLAQELSTDNLSGMLLNVVEAGKQLPKTLNEFEDLVHAGELLRRQGGTRRRSVSHDSIIIGILLVLMTPLVFWLTSAALRAVLLALVLPLFLLFILVTILKSEGE